ncbi:hypothetical protein COCCADRAFT_84009, partial [Bipolaris zeicola 26-R-13]
VYRCRISITYYSALSLSPPIGVDKISTPRTSSGTFTAHTHTPTYVNLSHLRMRTDCVPLCPTIQHSLSLVVNSSRQKIWGGPPCWEMRQ